MLKAIFELIYGKHISKKRHRKIKKILREEIDRKNKIIEELREKNKSLLNIAIKQSKKNIELNSTMVKKTDDKLVAEDYVEIVPQRKKKATKKKNKKKTSKSNSVKKKVVKKKAAKKTKTKPKRKATKKRR